MTGPESLCQTRARVSRSSSPIAARRSRSSCARQRASVVDRLVAGRDARRGHGRLLDIIEELLVPIVGPPTEEALDDLRAERTSCWTYLDTSAFIKLIRSEPEGRALRAELATGEALVSSTPLLVEGRRAAARYGALADAFHLAATLSLGHDLKRMHCYDTRLCAAAIPRGIDVRQPR